MPVLSAHKLVIGNTNADIGGKMTLTKFAKPDGTKVDDNGEMCILNFKRSGLLTAQSFQVKGEVTSKKDKEM